MRSSEVMSGSQELSSTLPDGSVSSELLWAPPLDSFLQLQEKVQWGLFLHQQLVSTQGQDLGLDPPPQIQGSFYSFVLPGLQGPPAGSAKAICKELTLRVTPKQMVAMPQEGGIPGAGEHLWAQRWGRGDDGSTDICD